MPSVKTPRSHSTAMLFPPQSNVPPHTGAIWSPPSYQTIPQEDATDWDVILADASSQAAANAPYSFHNRVRKTTLSQPQPSPRTMPEETYTDERPISHRADSGIGNLNDSPNFHSPVHDLQWTFDQAAYDGRFEDDYFHNDHTEEHDDDSQHTGSLQYHLIKTKSRTNCRTPHSDETRKAEVCPLCPNKQYTGVWAHRNLMRHMETMHAPCASSTGLKQIRCSFDGCDRTFRREDACLVHERRSHPELNRPPAAKRKRSDDL